MQVKDPRLEHGDQHRRDTGRCRGISGRNNRDDYNPNKDDIALLVVLVAK